MGLDPALTPVSDTDVPSFWQSLGDDWLQAICWHNPARLVDVTDI